MIHAALLNRRVPCLLVLGSFLVSGLVETPKTQASPFPHPQRQEDETTPLQIDQLIKGLEADRYEERLRARDALMLMGEAAQGPLRVALGQSPGFALRKTLEYILRYSPPQPKFVRISGGQVTLGTDHAPDNNPKRTVRLKPFEIATHELSSLEYRQFLLKTKHPSWPRHWSDGQYPYGEDAMPVRGISFDDARKCAEFYGARLPTFEEWEWAARGEKGGAYPWGAQWDDQVFLSRDVPTKLGLPTEDRSPFGILHLAGNVSEWCLNPSTEPPSPVVCGGSFRSNDPRLLRVSRRGRSISGRDRHLTRGFRLARSIDTGGAP